MARPGTDAPSPAGAARRSRRRWIAGGAVSGLVHVVVLVAFLAVQTPTAVPPDAAPVLLTLAPGPAALLSAPAPSGSAAAAEAPTPQSPSPTPLRPTPLRPRTRLASPLLASERDDEEAPTPAPSEAEIAGAVAAGSGSGAGEGSGSGRGGGPCDMGARVQAALRGDPLVRASAVSGGALGSAVWVWNGDWVRSGGQDGKGLAAVREAILWEVGFAPPECRTAPMRGLVLITLDAAAGAQRLVLGAQAWRWADLLHPRRDPRLEADAAGLRPAAR